jgi:hypothetical protein
MATNIRLVYDRLLFDAELTGTFDGTNYTGLASGGVWDHIISRSAEGEAERAFFMNPHTGQRLIKPCIMLVDGGDSRHRQRPQIPGAYNQVVEVYLFALANTSGKQRVQEMRQRVYELLDHDASGGWIFPSEDGPRVFAELVGRRGVRDSEIFVEAVEDIQRYQLTSRYANIV